MDDPEILKAKSCYGHLGGTLGNRLFERLIALGWFAKEEGAATLYRLTETGMREFNRLGVEYRKTKQHNKREDAHSAKEDIL